MGNKKQNKSGGFEDITSYSTPKGLGNKIKHFMDFKFKPFFLRNQKRNLKALLSLVICFVLIISALGGAYLRKMFNLINQSDGHFGNPDATFAAEDLEEDLSFNTIADIEGANSIKDWLKSWATNGGEEIYSKNVVNVLLVGEDNEDGSHRSDSTMLVSVNRKTKKIIITSFLRDSYTYMDINGSERYCKTNHSYAWGGAAKLMEVLSDNYKIKIDKYVSINYQSFKAAVDALGGVTVPITESEARFMNRTTRVKGFTSGDSVHLDGERALIYARIRKLDSEVERTRRQRELISSVIKNVKASSLSDLDNAIETFLPYVTTNLKTSEIISLGTQALSEGWLQYEIVSMVEPSEELRYGVSGFRTYTGYLDVWIVDYIKAARELQLAIYEQTNIEIDPATHVSAIDFARGASSYYDDYNDSDNSTTDNSEYETHYYEDEETTTKKGIFNWANKNEFTTPNLDIRNPFEDVTTEEDSTYLDDTDIVYEDETEYGYDDSSETDSYDNNTDWQ